MHTTAPIFVVLVALFALLVIAGYVVFIWPSSSSEIKELKPALVIDGKTIVPNEIYTVDGYSAVVDLFVTNDGIWWGGESDEPDYKRALFHLPHGDKVPKLILETGSGIPEFLIGSGNELYFQTCVGRGSYYVPAQHWRFSSVAAEDITSQLWGKEIPRCDGGIVMDKHGKIFGVLPGKIALANVNEFRSYSTFALLESRPFPWIPRLVGISSSDELIYLMDEEDAYRQWRFYSLLKIANGVSSKIFSSEGQFAIHSIYLNSKDEIFAVTETEGKCRKYLDTELCEKIYGLVRFKLTAGELTLENLNFDLRLHADAKEAQKRFNKSHISSISFDNSGNLYLLLDEDLYHQVRKHVLKYDLNQ